MPRSLLPSHFRSVAGNKKMKGKRGHEVLSCMCCDVNAGLKHDYLERLLKKEMQDLKGRKPSEIIDE